MPYLGNNVTPALLLFADCDTSTVEEQLVIVRTALSSDAVKLHRADSGRGLRTALELLAACGQPGNPLRVAGTLTLTGTTSTTHRVKSNGDDTGKSGGDGDGDDSNVEDGEEER